jgi:hypothetical protein
LLSDTVQLDERGRWLGRTGDLGFDLDVVQEDGQWRISEPPDRLVIPLSHFESRFQQFNLYYFDKGAEVLVPEPVHVPTGAQATTFLVDGLLAGPGRELLGVEQTFLPAGTRLDDISVPVTQDGTAEIPLSDEVLDAETEQLTRAFAQLAWTLAQVPGVEAIRVTVDGSPLDLPGLAADIPVDSWSEYDPAVAWASQSLFGVRGGRAVTQVEGEERRVSGAFGSLDLGLRAIGVDLPGERIAGTTADGSVLVSARSRVPGTVPKPADVRTVYAGGQRLLKPAWDLYGQLWLVDDTSGGAVVSVVRAGRARVVEVPGVSGREVSSFTLSRDGSRLVAEISGDARDRLVVSRVERTADGQVRRLRGTDRIPLGPLGITTIRDIAWRTPGSLAVLTAPTPGTSQVYVVEVDGSSTLADATTDAEVFGEATDTLVSSPVLGAPLYIRTVDGRMFALALNGRWTGGGIRPGLRSPTFVG